MRIRTEQEAMYLACRMEASAVQLYGRALELLRRLGREGEPLYARLARTRGDEEAHLRRFSELYAGLDATAERELELAAVGEGLLFEGGMMGAARLGLLDSVESMLALATRAEAASAQKYREFASLAQSEGARKALLLIAEEEDKHHKELEAQA